MCEESDSKLAAGEVVHPSVPGLRERPLPRVRIAAVTDANAIAGRIMRVRERIARAAERAGRRAEEVTLIAVSKTFPADAIRTAYETGVRHFGENRVQEFDAKRPALAGIDATWHMIGHLQGNKARRAAELFSCIDSVDGISLATRLNAAATIRADGKPLPVLIEVHLGGEESKSGVEVNALPTLAREVATECPNLELRGLMTIPPYAEDSEQARPYFRRLRELRDQLSGDIGRELPALSMGMSHDFEIAIEEGSTEVRIGTVIFGARQRKNG